MCVWNAFEVYYSVKNPFYIGCIGMVSPTCHTDYINVLQDCTLGLVLPQKMHLYVLYSVCVIIDLNIYSSQMTKNA